ncbi:MAG: ribosomal protein L13e [Candidatus Sifarchaeia archaeon]
MSFDIIAEPTVKSPRDARPKRGRGFSIEETVQAGLTITEARRMGLIVDKRRKTVHPENVDALKQYMKDLEELVAALAEEAEPVKAKAKEAVDDLASLRAVKKSDVPLLAKAGIKTFEDLAYCDITKIAKKTGIEEDRITEMVKAALKKV